MKNSQTKVFLSIVTATYNSGEDLKTTAFNLRKIPKEHYEWIIVDGGSSDDTIGVVFSNLDIIDKWISQSDCGIYDAWNKGVALSEGEWVSFLGAGDYYLPNATLIYMQEALRCSDVNFIVSDVAVIDGTGNFIRKIGSPFNKKNIIGAMKIAHVGAIHHRSIINLQPFSTNYKYASDYLYLLNIYNNIKSRYINKITAKMLCGGVTDGTEVIHEAFKINLKKFGFIFAFYNLVLPILKFHIRKLIK